MKGTAIRKPDFRLFFSGLLPLFILAHFGHHVSGAMLRPLLPMIRTDLGLNYTQSGFVLSAFAITSGVSQLPGGWLADRFGPRVVVGIGVSGVAVAGLLIGLSHSYAALIVFLVVAAIMGGGYHPAAAATISSSVSPERRGRALGLHLIGGTSAFWVVPFLATPIAVAWNWRGSYIALTIPTIVLGIVLYSLIGRRVRARTAEPETVHIESSAAPARIRWRQLVPFIGMSIAIGTTIQSVSGYLSLLAVDVLGATEAAAAMLMAISPAVGLFAAPLGGYLSDRFGRITVLIAVSYFAIPLVCFLGVVPNIVTLAALMFFIGIVTNTRMPTSEAYIAERTPERRRSTTLGVYFFAGAELGGLLTPAVGYLIDRRGFPYTFTAASITLAVVVVVCSLFLWRSRERT